MPKRVTRSNIESVAIKAARAAARIQLRHYMTGLKPTFKGEINLVTQADLESQAAIAKIVGRAFPSHDILAEEENLGHDRSLEGPIWVIDPLDGTTNYAHGFPQFGISIAYREGGETLFGLGYHPLLKEMFIAHRGRGALMNRRRIRVSAIANLNHSLLASGFPYDRRDVEDNNLNYFCYFEMATQCLRRTGAAVFDLMNIACGRLDGFWEPRLAPWDIAAGMLMIEEAGGQCSDFNGHPITDLRCGELIASNGMIHDQILRGRDIAKKTKIPNLVTQLK